jgi:hypothetical protein
MDMSMSKFFFAELKLVLGEMVVQGDNGFEWFQTYDPWCNVSQHYKSQPAAINRI